MITEVESQDGGDASLPESAIARVDVMGEFGQDARGRDLSSAASPPIPR